MWQSTQSDWFLAVNQFAQSTPVLHAPMKLHAEYGVTLFAALLLVAWWWARRDPNPKTMAAAVWAPAGALLAPGLNQPPVNLAHEPRPYTVFPHAVVLVAHSQDYSFPSDHAVMRWLWRSPASTSVRTSPSTSSSACCSAPLSPAAATWRRAGCSSGS